MEQAALKTIVLYADGDGSLRAECVGIYTQELRRVCLLADDERLKVMNSPAMKFMGEIDNTCPDLALRRVYRTQLLEQAERMGILGAKSRRPPDMKVAATRRRGQRRSGVK